MVLLHTIPIKKSIQKFSILSIVVLFFAFSAWGALLSIDTVNAMNFKYRMITPNMTFVFGTDLFGRDLFLRFISGTYTMFLIVVPSIIISAIVGTSLAMINSYNDSIFKPTLLSHLTTHSMTMIFAFPLIIVGLLLKEQNGGHIINSIVVIALAFIPIFYRMTFVSALEIWRKTYTRQALHNGHNKWYCIRKHIFPNIKLIVISAMSIQFAMAILVETALSYLGVSPVTTPSWGSLLLDIQSIIVMKPTIMIPSGIVMTVFIGGFIALGDMISQQSNPYEKSCTCRITFDEQPSNGSISDTHHITLHTQDETQLSIPNQSITAIIGKSGIGKTTLFKETIKHYLNNTNTPFFNSRYVIGFLSQNSARSLSPCYSLLSQAKEITTNTTEIHRVFKSLGMENLAHKKMATLSGGQQTRACLALNILLRPNVLLLDEPTASLDAKNKKLVEDTLLTLNKNGTTIIWITHELSSVENICSHVITMNNETTTGTTSSIEKTTNFFNPNSTQSPLKRAFLATRTYTPDHTFTANKDTPICVFDDVSLGYNNTPILNGVSFTLYKGDIMGILGDSGMGKTTILNAMTKQLSPLKGTITSNASFGIIHQNPMDSLNPKLPIIQSVMEPLLVVSNAPCNKALRLTARNKAHDILCAVGIPKNRHNDYPHQFSGGQCQRITIAYAIMNNPDVIIADEITSALDTITRKNIMGLLLNMAKKQGTTIVFVSHDAPLVKSITNRVFSCQEYV